MNTTHDNPTTRRLVDSAELRKMLPLGRTTFYKAIRQPDFPAPIQLIEDGDYLWFYDEVEAYLEHRRCRPGTRRPPEALPEEPVLVPRGRAACGSQAADPHILRPTTRERSRA